MAAPRQNQWFLPGTGIAREVITADIQRYLGPDALVKPGVGTGEHLGQSGYWITAYRTLTTNMIDDLKLDSQRWGQERQPNATGRVPSYETSQTHASRQHYGPTTPYNPPQAQAQHPQAAYDPHRSSNTPSRQNYTAPSYESNYVAAANTHYPTGQSGTGYSNTPRTVQSTDQYTYQTHQQSAARADTRGYPQSPQYVDAYGRPVAAAPASQYTAQSQPNPNDYYTASDGRHVEYLRSQQPQAQPTPNPPSGTSRDPRYGSR